jgi:hypothetical protein
MAYKGRASTEEIERRYPHIVELMVPLNGFGTRLNLMHDWHFNRAFKPNEVADVITKNDIMFDGASPIPKKRRRFRKSLAVS